MAKPIFSCGVVLLIAITSAAQLNARADVETFLAFIALAAVAYVVALLLVARGRTGTRRELWICLLLAFAWRLPAAVEAPLLSDDVYRYVWDGRVQRFGYSPYAAAPADPALQHLHTDVTRRIDPTSAALPTIYPPAAELFFRAAVSIDESVAALAVATLVCDAIIVWLLWSWLAAAGRSPWWVLAYAWHPLVTVEGAGGAHVDLLGTMLLVLAGYALVRGRTLAATTALGAAAAVKFLPIVLAPLLVGRVRWRDAAVAATLVAMLYMPFLGWPPAIPVGSLGAYVEGWRFNGPVFDALEPWVGATGALGVAAAAGLMVAIFFRRRVPDAPDAWAWPIAVTVLCLPVVYPWYLLWVVPFLTGVARWPLVVWTIMSMSTYIVWQSQLAGAGWTLPAWVVPVEYGLFAGSIVLCAGAIWRSGRLTAPGHTDEDHMVLPVSADSSLHRGAGSS